MIVSLGLVLGICLMNGDLHLLIDALEMFYHLISLVIQTTNTQNKS